MIKQRSNLTLPVSLYAIGNVKDELNLHTGELTHRIGKIELTGTENWQLYSATSTDYGIWQFYVDRMVSGVVKSSAMSNITVYGANVDDRQHHAYGCYLVTSGTGVSFQMAGSKDVFTGISAWKQFLSDEYAAGHPVTVWYVLAEPTTEIVTVPEDVSGIIEGYLIQDGTPTPTNPIYPTSCDSVDIWNEIMYRQYGVNETLSPIPTTVFSQGDGIDSCIVYGNAVQNGTPTPTAPVDIYGVGDINTNNLADLYGINKTTPLQLTFSTTDNMRVVINGTKKSGANVIPVKYPNIIVPAGTYTVKIKMVAGSITNLQSDGVFFGINGNTYSQRTTPAVTQIGEVGIRTFTLSTDTKISSFDLTPSYGNRGVFDNATFECWFYKGSSSDNIPYEPYGYKVGLDIDSQIANIYLGTTQSTRIIQKLVLTGNESWTYISGGKFWITVSGYLKDGLITRCTHYIGTTNASGSASFPSGTIGFYNTINDRLMISDASFNDTATFVTYLQQQYQAGTPVTVWYVLAEPQTTALNEPLMKIGDYADSVTYDSNIPTTYGQNDITTDTQIKPSKLDITYNALRRAKVYKNNRWILNPSIDWSQTLKISDLQSKKIKEMEGEYIGYNIHT